MDTGSPTFGKQNRIMVSRKTFAFILVLFVCGVIATGLLVYNFASCSQPESRAEESKQTSCVNTTTTPAATVEPITTPTMTAMDTSTEPPATSPTPREAPNVRLSTKVKPEYYTLRLIPFITEGNFTFNGVVDIIVNIFNSTSSIILHYDDMTIDHAKLTVHEVIKDPSSSIYTQKRSIPIKHIGNDTAKQFLVIELNEQLNVEMQYKVHIEYVGILNDILQGFYRSSYTVDNQTKWIAATQFQPTDARKAFPCFDEPGMKAKFKISLARPKNMTSLSNMPKIGNPQDDPNLPGYEWDHYEESAIMSTYLVAFAVTDFGHLDHGNFSVWARKDALQQANYSLLIGPKVLNYFERFFQIPFPLPKMDMIALPDFSAGAMENWGLITYRETAMLYQEGVSTSMNLQRVATVVAHELAHQWFGNLVTPQWWTDLWLNEGFATYLEYMGADAVQPDWHILDQFVTLQLHYSFALDALKNSHQISIEVGHPDEINEIFDRISYAKGASVIRMMDHFLTTAVFKSGLTYYLNDRKYQNAEQDDLWEALTLHAHKNKIIKPEMNVKDIMDTWTLQTGFPVVTATRNYADGSVYLTQERFMLLPNKTESKSELWWVPITYTTQREMDFTNTTTKVWMKKVPSIQIEKIPADKNEWLLLNIQETGYYRVNYDDDNWKLIIKHLRDENNFKKFGTLNRAQILDDSLNLARAGRLNYSIALDATRYLEHEREYIPWQAAFGAFAYIDSMFVRTGHYDKFKDYMLTLIGGLYKDIGYHEKPTDTQITIYKRVDMLYWACTLGLHDCVRNSITEFQNWKSTPNPDSNNPISPNLKSIVYCTALRVGGQEEWDFAWQRYLNSNVGSEKELLLSAMGCSKETWILSRYLSWSITDNSGIRKQDAARVFAAVSSNTIGQELAFNFLRTNWLKIREYMGTSLSVINNIVRTCTKQRNTIYEVKNLQNFAKDYRLELSTASRTLKQAIEDAEANVNWMDRNYDRIVKWMTTWRSEK